jgi:hypothetical protein
MGRRAWIIALAEFVSHRVHSERVYATASPRSERQGRIRVRTDATAVRPWPREREGCRCYGAGIRTRPGTSNCGHFSPLSGVSTAAQPLKTAGNPISTVAQLWRALSETRCRGRSTLDGTNAAGRKRACARQLGCRPLLVRGGAAPRGAISTGWGERAHCRLP